MIFGTYSGAAIQDGGSDLSFEVPAKKLRNAERLCNFRENASV
jgi:hypothetical protein